MDAVNNTTENCPNLHGNSGFGLMSWLLMSFGTLSLLMNLIYAKVLFSCGGHLQTTTKFLLINCSFASVGKSLYYIFYFPIYNFVLLGIGFDTAAMSRTTCALVSVGYGICGYTLPISMFFVGCERFYMTWKKNLIQEERIITSLVVMFFAWIGGVLTYTGTMTIDSSGLSQTVCYCYFPMIMSAGAGNLSNVIMIGTQSLNVLIYAFIYWKNKRNVFDFTLNTARYSLSERFIMWANIKTTFMLLPATLLHASTSCSMTVVNRLLRTYFNYKVTDDYLCSTMGVLCIVSLDALGHAVLCLKYGNILGELAATMYPKLSFLFGKRNLDMEKDHVVKPECGVNTVSTTVPYVARRQQTLNPQASVHQSHLLRSVIEFKIKPEEHRDMLTDIWNKEIQRKSRK